MRWRGYGRAYDEWYGVDLLQDVSELIEDYERRTWGDSGQECHSIVPLGSDAAQNQTPPLAISGPWNATQEALGPLYEMTPPPTRPRER